MNRTRPGDSTCPCFRWFRSDSACRVTPYTRAIFDSVSPLRMTCRTSLFPPGVAAAAFFATPVPFFRTLAVLPAAPRRPAA
jgi:hypothetical protein